MMRATASINSALKPTAIPALWSPWDTRFHSRVQCVYDGQENIREYRVGNVDRIGEAYGRLPCPRCWTGAGYEPALMKGRKSA